MNKKTWIFSLAVIVAASFLPASGADWPCWRGPDKNGISNETGWGPAGLMGEISILWRTNVGLGHSAVCTVGQCVVTMGNKEVDIDTGKEFRDFVYCLDAETGEEIWSYSYPCKDTEWPGPRSTPAIDGESLYTLSWEGDLFCLDLFSGKVIWKRNLVSESLCKAHQSGFCPSPIVEGDLLVLNVGESGVALDKKTGKTVWASAPETGGNSTPVPYTCKGKMMAAFSGQLVTHGVDLKTGKVEWTYRWQSDADPVVSEDKVFLTGGGRRSGCVLLDISGEEPELLWKSRNMKNTFQTGVIMNGCIFGFGNVKSRPMLACLSMKTGEVMWSEDMGYWGSLSAANGKLIVIDGDGDLVIVEATGEEYRELGELKIFEIGDWRAGPEGRFRACWTAPVLSNGYVFVRDTYGNLVCIDLKL